jgi:ATP-dependent RNA helicase RhlE
MSFESLGLRAELVRAASEKGYSEPTPIQIQAIPLILKGKDLMGGAQTGTGKTAGFTLPMLQRLMESKPQKGRRAIRTLVLTPTRELAAQVTESVRDYGKHLPIRTTSVFGGVSINPQIKKLRDGVDILVATPGRLLDHVGQNTVDLSRIEILILDEADRMLDMGFIHDIRKVLKLVPKKKQTLLFSATFSNEIKHLAGDLLNEPELIEVAQRNTSAERVTQVVHPVDAKKKRKLLSKLIGAGNWKQVLVFARTKRNCDRLAQSLIKDGLDAAAIHGGKSQGARTKALAHFKSGKVRVLVATDIAARGLDISQLPHVVNYELPHVPEDYVHRIGRTGRAGHEGEAISLVCIDEAKLLKDIERLIKIDIPKLVIENFEVDPTIKAQPITMGRQQQPRHGGGQNQSQRNAQKHGSGAKKPSQRRRSASGKSQGNGGNGNGNGNKKKPSPSSSLYKGKQGQSGNRARQQSTHA